MDYSITYQPIPGKTLNDNGIITTVITLDREALAGIIGAYFVNSILDEETTVNENIKIVRVFDNIEMDVRDLLFAYVITDNYRPLPIPLSRFDIARIAASLERPLSRDWTMVLTHSNIPGIINLLVEFNTIDFINGYILGCQWLSVNFLERYHSLSDGDEFYQLKVEA